MKRLAAALLAAALALPALAQDDPEARRAAAQRYMQSEAQQRMIEQTLSPDALVAQIGAMTPGLDDAAIRQIAAVASEELAPLLPKLEAAMVDAAVETFTVAEIEALDAFYRTPEGIAIAAKMQPFMQRALGALGPDLQQAQMRIMQRVLGQ